MFHISFKYMVMLCERRLADEEEIHDHMNILYQNVWSRLKLDFWRGLVVCRSKHRSSRSTVDSGDLLLF